MVQGEVAKLVKHTVHAKARLLYPHIHTHTHTHTHTTHMPPPPPPHTHTYTHYTQVTYNIEGFLDKNRDLLFKDLSKAMYACERGMLQELFPEGNLELKMMKRPPTAGTQLRSSVSLLMKNLLSKNPNYIRCIKVCKSEMYEFHLCIQCLWLRNMFHVSH